MQYIYHGLPEQMMGTELIPLNQMHTIHPELRDKYLEKYRGREEILERRVPLLDCLWNDVVQFLPFHPRKVFELQAEMKLIPEVPHYKFFEIDLKVFDPAKTVIFFKDKPGEENVAVKWLADVDFDSIQDIPQATIEYYKTLVGTGELPFNYQFVPHVVYIGNVDVSGSKVISL